MDSAPDRFGIPLHLGHHHNVVEYYGSPSHGRLSLQPRPDLRHWPLPQPESRSN